MDSLKRQGIGYHVAKHLAQKAARAAEEDSTVTESEPTPHQEAPAEPSMAQVLAMMASLQQQTLALMAEFKQSGNTDQSAVIERLLAQQEALLVKARPENAEHPGISVFSHPEGDKAHPKAPLRTKMFWVGYQLATEGLTPTEIHYLNRLQPGVFMVMKSDGSRIPFKVSAKYSDAIDPETKQFALEELSIWFPCKGDHRQNHGSMISYCQQALGDAIPTAEELMVELARLKAELAVARTGVLSPV